MRRHDRTPKPRFWRSIKWTAGGLFAMILLAWVATATWTIDLSRPGYDIHISSGRVHIIRFARFRGGEWSVRRNQHAGQQWWFDWSSGGTSRARFLTVPLWALAVPPLLIAPVARRRQLLASRSLRGHCPFCNYDRRGIGPATPCPECGAAPAPPAAMLAACPAPSHSLA